MDIFLLTAIILAMPLRVGLTYTQMKLGWAYKRLDELNRVVDEVRKDAYLIVREDDINKPVHRIRLTLKPQPDALGMLPGEFAYALRSGLDHLAWQLALITTDKPGRKTAFPIESECPLSSNKSYREKIEHIPPVAVTVIESLQPYNSGPAFKSHPLWQLNKLSNIDKHQVVAVSHTPLLARVDGVSNARRRDLQNGIEIGIPLAEKDNLQLNVEAPGIIFGEPIDRVNGVSVFEITMDGLRGIYNFIRHDVVPKFERFFV